jgi:hypothetical protein
VTGLILLWAFGWCAAQGPVDSPKESRSAGTHVPGVEYPRIDTVRRVIFKVLGPDAKQVRIRMGGRIYDLLIDGMTVSDPAG